MFELRLPEIGTVVRWLLRFLLAAFLIWMMQQRQKGDDDDASDSTWNRIKRKKGNEWNKTGNGMVKEGLGKC